MEVWLLVFLIGNPSVYVPQDLYATKAACEERRTYWQGRFDEFKKTHPDDREIAYCRVQQVLER